MSDQNKAQENTTTNHGRAVINKQPDGSYVKKVYDPEGRETYYESRKVKGQIYWSTRIWTDHADGTVTMRYLNARDEYHTKYYNEFGELVRTMDDNGIWEILVDTSHRVAYNPTLDKYQISGEVMSKRDILIWLKDPKRKVCPTVFQHIENNPFELKFFKQKEPGFFAQLWQLIKGIFQ